MNEEFDEVIEDTEKKDCLTQSDWVEMIVILAEILLFIVVSVACFELLGFKDLAVQQQIIANVNE